MSSSDKSDTAMDCTPPNLKEEAKLAMENLLPAKSKERYMKTYEAFMQWRKQNQARTFSESVFLAYFSEISKIKKPSTLWATYSMLRCMLQLKHDVNIKTYENLKSFLKRQSAGFKTKKSKIFTADNVTKFLNEAPDDKFLATKVIILNIIIVMYKFYTILLLYKLIISYLYNLL